MIEWIRSEPALILGAVQACVTLAAAFGLHLTGEQVSAISAASAAILAVICRQMVTPMSKAQ